MTVPLTLTRSAGLMATPKPSSCTYSDHCKRRAELGGGLHGSASHPAGRERLLRYLQACAHVSATQCISRSIGSAAHQRKHNTGHGVQHRFLQNKPFS